jgi:hypothetical protein
MNSNRWHSMIEDFGLGDYRDRCGIFLNDNGIICYYEKPSFKSGLRRHYHTEEFCREIGMSGEETVFWVLKYGVELPEYLHELQGVSVS